MKTNRKTRPQPSLAALTTDEYRQLADMVCTRTYEDVRQQVNKPRSAGGFDLNISIKPLQVLHARVQRLNKINERLAAGEKLTLTAYDEIHAGEKRAPEEIHDAIMSATYLLVTEHDNTPHQLLALQRLADFPARAELRAAKEQRAQAAADRAQEMHLHKTALDLREEAHKVQMDLRKFEHKLTMDTFHKHITAERLSLQKDALTLREKRHQDRLVSPSPLRGDHNSRSEQQFEGNKSEAASGTHCASLLPILASSPTSTSRDEIYETDAAPADLLATDDENSKEPLSEAEIAALIPHVISPRPLPPEVIAANLRYAEKVRTGKIIIDRSGHYIRAIELPDTDANPAPSSAELHSAVSPICNRQPGATPASTPQIPAAPETQNQDSEHLSTLDPQLSTTANPSPTSALIPAADLPSIVDAYTILRAQEYWSHRRTYSDPPRVNASHPEYITEHRHCPCGQGTASTPCPIHESDEFGPFPNYFWKLSPHSVDYAATLRERNLPYRNPTEFL